MIKFLFAVKLFGTSSEIRSQKSEVRGQRSEVKGEKRKVRWYEKPRQPRQPRQQRNLPSYQTIHPFTHSSIHPNIPTFPNSY